MIKENRETMDNYIMNKYLKNQISIVEHFNWLTWGLSYYYNYSFLSQNSNWFHVSESGLPNIDSIEWIDGFEWKGLFIKVQSKEKSKALLNEIKALNYAFFDYIQIIDTYKIKQSNLLSNELIFPLISYAEIGGLILLVTPCVNKFKYDYGVGTFEEEQVFKLPSVKERKNSENSISNKKGKNKSVNRTYMSVNRKNTHEQKSRISLDFNCKNYHKIIKQIDINDCSHIDVNSIYSMNISNIANEDIDLKQYTMLDLQESLILKQINSKNLIKVIFDLSPNSKKNHFKFMLTNAVNLIPDLYETNKLQNQYNFISFDDETKIRKQVSINKQSNTHPRDILEKEYRIPYSPSLCVYDNIYSAFEYKLIYVPNKNKINLNTKIANDYLVNLMFKQNDSLSDSIKSSNELKSMFNLTSLDLNISEPYALLYSLRYPIKKKYSLIKSINKVSKNNINNDSLTSFTKHFNLFCVALNRKSSLIKTIHHLKQFFHKYGINMSMQIFTLNKLTNKPISDFIKISIFVNVIKDFFCFHESSNLMMKMFLYEGTHDIDYLRNTSFNFHQDKDIQMQAFIRKEYTINKIRKEKILFLIKAILYPSEEADEKYTSFIYEQLSFFLFLKTLKWKLMDEAFTFNLIKSDSSTKDMLDVNKLIKEYTMISREYPFIFLSSIEEALHIVVAPFTKFKSSFSLRSMSNNTLQLEDIILNDPVVTSFIKPKEISGYILAKCITISNSFNENNNGVKLLQKQKEMNVPINTLKSINTKINIQQYTVYNNDMSRNVSFQMNSNNITNINQINDNSIFKTVNNNKSYLIDNINTNNKSQINKKELDGNYFDWKDISDSFVMSMPSICYKLLYQNEEVTHQSHKKSIYKYLSHSYSFANYDCISDWKNSIELLFNGVSSSDGGSEQCLFQIYIIDFISAFYIEKHINQATEILNKMKDIMKSMQMFTFNDCAIINLFSGLVTEKYIDSEEFYSKSLIFSLFQYGDPRGRRSQGHFGMMYPLWKIARQTCALENSLTNENFKEMFHCLDDIQNQRIFSNDIDNECNIFDDKITNFNYQHSGNNINALFKSDTITKENTIKDIKINIESNQLNDDFIQDEINECLLINQGNSNQDTNCYISQIVFDNEYLYLIKPFPFPSTSDLKTSYLKMFLRKEYTLYILKTIMAMIEDQGCLLIEEVLDFSSMNFINQIRENENKIGVTLTPITVNLKKKNGTVLSHFIFNELMEKMSFKQNIPEEIILSFGKNSYNETTHDNYDILTLPRVTYKLKDVEVKKIIGGWEHNFVIDKKGNSYSWGRNQHGQCGIGNLGISHDMIIRNPKRVKFDDKDIKIKKISCGNEHSLFLTTQGDVYACGNSEDGVIGLNNKTNQYSPIRISELKNIESIACGTIHNLALDKDGCAYSWGSSRGGQLGLSEQYISSHGNMIYLNRPKKITDLSQKIIQISAGEAHSLALNDKGEVYGWGFNSNGQLGIGWCEDSFEAGIGLLKSKVSKPQLIDTISQVDSIQCGKIFTMFITKEKEIYACGGNDVNQLGIEDLPPRDHLYDKTVRCVDFVLPTPIESFLYMKVIKIACGESHCLAIINDPISQIQNVWSWGNNRFGQLGIGKHFKSSQPKPINYLLSYYNSKIGDISCGGYHSLCLLKSKQENNQQTDEDIILKAINNSFF